jgi:signal peptidase
MALRLRRRVGLTRPPGGTKLPLAGAVSIAVLLPLATLLVATWLLGWQLQSVESGSMEPTYPVGSLLVVGPQDPSRVQTGTVIVFEDPAVRDRLVSHRVIGRVGGDVLAFRTQGDANGSPDPFAVPARLVRGRVLWHVTHLGSALAWLRWPRSFLVLIALPAAFLVSGEWLARNGAAGRRARLPDRGFGGTFHSSGSGTS